jgi:hypothetical protein
MPSSGFEPTNPVSEQRQTHALDRAATGIGHYLQLEFHTFRDACLILPVTTQKREF